MKPQHAEKWLILLFRLNALLLTTACLTLFFPNPLMHRIHRVLGLGEMPPGPIVEYLARSCSMLYFVHGLVLGYVSWQIRKYWELVPLLAGLHLLLGAMVLAVDLKAGMPWYWTAAEGPGIMIFASLLLLLWSRASSAAPARTGS